MDFTNKGQPDTPLPLARQGSVYSLTFDEFQSTLGGGSKDFGSMNMDELLKSIWDAEETHAIAVASATGSGPSTMAHHQQAGEIPRQGSLTLPRTLSHKTVDQVWRDMVGFGGTNTGNAGQSSTGPGPSVAGGIVTKEEIMPQREPTLGEITLEEFLVRAGVVREEPGPQPTPFVPAVPTVCENSFGQLTGSQMPPRSFGFTNGSATPGFGMMRSRPVTIAVGSPTDLNGNSSDLSPVPVPYMFKGGLRGRKGGATVEKVVERRQRRMIKNRESAARSRARKQAHMMELEAEIAKLKEQNKELQEKQIEMVKLEKDEVVEMVNQQPRCKSLCLRRTYTGPW